MKGENHLEQVQRKDIGEASRALGVSCEAHHEAMIPLLNIVVEAKIRQDAFIDMAERPRLDAAPLLSATETAPPRHQRKTGHEIRRHGIQSGMVTLATLARPMMNSPIMPT